jgi:serine/threonine protein kinase
MALTAGTRLGPYEIVTSLGAGGMGQVYRARDTRLDRTVAIKVLSDSLSGDRQFRERFEREARAISALNHPHICTLHDVGEHNGVSYLVMEHVDGTPLAERLAAVRDPSIHLRESLRYAREICQALEAAHRAGIVHRDLKPANILVTKQGVKLLDFGLARSVRSPEDRGDATVAALTGAHTILGTPQYMAPEQIEGRDADVRTDIFAFGCVLYEMLTGKPAFQGSSPSAVMAAILATEPRPLRELLPISPPALERLVRTCLGKDPDSRYQTAHDVRLHLESIIEDLELVTGTAATQSAWTPDQKRLAWLIGASLALAAAILAGYALRPRAPAAPSLSVDLNLPGGFSIDDTNASLALSPDGQKLVVAGSAPGSGQRLWLRSLSSQEAQPIAGTEDATYPFWSPDSRSLGFFAARVLKKIDLATGALQTLGPANSPRGGSWGPDGTIVLAPDYRSGLFRVPASGGALEPVTRPEPGFTHRLPSFLPDGRHFLFLAAQSTELKGVVQCLDLATGKVEPVVTEPYEARYAPPGYLLFLRGPTLMAQPFDAVARRTTGAAVVFAEDVVHTMTRYTGQFSTSATGTLIYQRSRTLSPRQLTIFDSEGKRVAAVGEPARFSGDVNLSPDGTRALAHVETADSVAVWKYDLATGVGTRLTFGETSDSNVAWSPNGKEFAFADRGKIVGQVVDGSSAPRVLRTYATTSPDTVQSWSPDGRHVVITLQQVDSIAILDVPLETQAQPSPLVSGPSWALQATISPDGKALAYMSNVGGQYDVHVTGFPAAGGTLQVSSGGGQHPNWIKGGAELVYINNEHKLVSVEMTRAAGQLAIGRPRLLFGGRPLPVLPGEEGDREGGSPVYITSDGSRILLAVPTNMDSVTPLTLITNWAARLQIR